MKSAIVAASFAITALFSGASFAGASSQEYLDLCAAALDDRGIASLNEYRKKFKSARGGGLKKISVEMLPIVDGKEPIKATCLIRKGEVIDVVIKS